MGACALLGDGTAFPAALAVRVAETQRVGRPPAASESEMNS